jgi:arginyl-tRNA synthetase
MSNKKHLQNNNSPSKKVFFSSPRKVSSTDNLSTDFRFFITNTIQNLVQRYGFYVASQTTTKDDSYPNIEEFFNSIKTNNQVYKASLSRQLSADLSPDVEETTFKDTAKSWFIKSADFGDNYDQLLQHPDGRFTQLLEDIARYHQIFQQGYDKIILLRPPIYTGYDIQLTAAMQCLGYTKEQFQFIIVQPIKFYAFHQPTQKIHPLPDIPTDELIKAIGMDALRWHSFRVPLTGVAPINISTAGQPTFEDTLYRVQYAHARCCTLLQEAHRQGIIKLDTQHWQIAPAPQPLNECVWNSAEAAKLANLLQLTPKILQQSAAEIAHHLVCQHLEAIANSCDRSFADNIPNRQDCALLLAAKQTIFDLLENILEIAAPESL